MFTLLANSYDCIRDKIEDGDIIFLYRGSNFMSKMIQFVTRSAYSHCGIAFWITTATERRLMMVEAQGGNHRRIVNAALYERYQMDVIKSPRPWIEMEHEIMKRIGRENYSIAEAALVGIRDFTLKYFSIRLPGSIDLAGEICSEFVAKAVGLTKTVISPGELRMSLELIGCEVKFLVRR